MGFATTRQLLTLKEACDWASSFLGRNISESNISYLIQYGKVKKYGENGSTQIDACDLKNYYQSFNGQREVEWKKKLGNDLNWSLSFDNLREKDTTKHVHRLHPYKGKFIPQLVEYFIDDHTDDFKKQSFFKKDDIILDPFSGSGTTLVQANELGIHSIGIDISRFNCMITDTKLLDYDLDLLIQDIKTINIAITKFETDAKIQEFEKELYLELTKFNNKNFPSPDYKRKIYKKEIDENKYSATKEKGFLNIYNKLVAKYKIELKQEKNKTFLDRWYIKNIRKEIDFAFDQIKKIRDEKNKRILAVILSRTIRSCRATTHSDLATLKEPQITTYYCWKHKKICKPLFSIKYWFDRYANDTIARIKEFQKLKNGAHWASITGDSRTVDIGNEIKSRNKKFYKLLKKQKIQGIFSSPPYVGQIDYHEQHAYAYDLFGFERKDELEIGPLYKGQGLEAKKSYAEGISQVLLNSKKYLSDNFDVFLVANDKWNLYPQIAEKAGMKIVNQFKRPVLNRTERDKNPYSEIIFHFKKI
ncbi:site-specific DNA-methyltransferase [Patescibacteria group bacterium]|nr:site-specific DNA-methyltransferase [Patescibacteria group bacterium]MBU1663470.1 site-specific DNA-methyltransferase [Patescibacteria group bacterium]MBU1933715.1 site-specific DNA-methyltransferase [Patescibacteria group bacterium]MBU2233313.1 site-specific DNA-methyltransferase [Patescibacteria group bacterium]MBU2263928.1 site-specific DNA-methyltransferase [Patescibacteria group bacterium]